MMQVEENSSLYQSIPLAAIFAPTEEEFKEPLDYINHIRPKAEKYGICKVIPPKNWKPKFSIDMNTFRFRPRVQRLNELEANNRIKLNFLGKLSKFWDLQGKKLRVPTLEGRQVDLLKVFKTVDEYGGFESVIKTKRWSQLARQLNYKDVQSARILKTHYENLLYPFKLFELGATMPVSSGASNRNPDEESHEEIEDITNKTGGGGGGYRGSAASSSKRKQPTAATNSSSKTAKSDKDNSGGVENIKCLVCGWGDDEAFMLLCDGCDDSYHTFCLYPPLKEVPKGDWRCPGCVAELCKKPTDSYGFEQSGDTYTLNEFGKMADEFKSEHFRKPHRSVSLSECEDEFWRILSSADESVIVEYGADLHTIDTGSGFPTRSNRGKLKQNSDPYSESPWNLNNLSMLDKSMLSLMNVPISGMKIPWAYVGMCFSCFCWHVEDHWSYSINYLHFGEAKTWYGVAGQDAEKFEAVMKQSAKELFEISPDLLHHLVTIMDPKFLQSNGVPIYKAFQNAGEFVITFPRAYHAGFNQGFNFAEAVNFCPADWIPLGRAAIESYKNVKRHTVFSHDELVCKVATRTDLLDLNTAVVVQRDLKRLIDFEKAYRLHLLESGIKHGNKLAFELLSDDERTCDFCKTTCFVSAVKCSCRAEVMVCLNHLEHLCVKETPTATNATTTTLNNNKSAKSPNKRQIKAAQNNNSNNNSNHHHHNHHQFTVLYRYTLEELTELYARLQKHTHEYARWTSDVRKCLNITSDCDIEVGDQDQDVQIIQETSPKPRLSQLQKLLEQARSNKYPRFDIPFEPNHSSPSSFHSMDYEDSLLNRLERECQLAAECSEMCQKFLLLYKSSLKSVKIETKQTAAVAAAAAARPTLEQLKHLAENVSKLSCELDETDMFLSLIGEALEYEHRIGRIVRDWNVDTPHWPELRAAVDYASRGDIEFPPRLVEQLRLLYRQAKWLQAVNQAVTEPVTFTLKIMRGLIDECAHEDLCLAAPPTAASLNSNNTALSSVAKQCQVVQKTFSDLQDLFSIAQTWDDKARMQIQSKSVKLEDLEKTLIEARHIPVFMENVEKLEKLVKEASKTQSYAELILKDSKCPYLSDLIEAQSKIKQLPLRSTTSDVINVRTSMANEWLKRLSQTYLKPDALHLCNIGGGLDSLNIPLLEALTPRLDLKSLINKLHAILVTTTTNIAQTAATTTNTTAAVDASSSPSSSQPPESSSQSTTPAKQRARAKPQPLSHPSVASHSQQQLLELIVSHIDSISDLYKDRCFATLSEKYKALQVRELELVKVLRRLNSEKLGLLRSQIASEISRALAAVADNNGETAAVMTMPTIGSGEEAKLGHSNVRCCSCSKSILASIYARTFQQCRLCLGLFHINCRNAMSSRHEHHHYGHRGLSKYTLSLERDTYLLCHGCERTRRPCIDPVVGMLVQFEDLEVRAYEANALQMQLDRVLKWQEKWTAVQEAEPSVKRVLETVRRFYASERQPFAASAAASLAELKALYDEAVPILVRAKLGDLHLEGLLLEAELHGVKTLNEMFYLLEMNENDELARLRASLSSVEPRAMQYLEERVKSMNRLSEEMKKEKKQNVKKLISHMTAATAGSTTATTAASTASSANSAASKTVRSGKDRSGTGKSVASGRANKSANKSPANNQRIDSTMRIKKKNQKKDELSNSKSRKRDHNEIDEVSDELCAASKCTQPAGDNIKWVQCDGDCNRWFHMICMGISKIKKREQYVCEACSNSKNGKINKTDENTQDTMGSTTSSSNTSVEEETDRNENDKNNNQVDLKVEKI